MLYAALKIYIRLALLLFCRKLTVNRPELLRHKGPLLLAANHPNSFLDAIILDTLFSKPIWSLARGDVFVSPFIRRLLHAIRILPVYRVSEGVENLSTNYETFDACLDIFRKNGVVLIFSEGKCVNEWHLRPLRKGTARLACSSWEQQIPLQILPIGINYSSFIRFGKNIWVNLGTPFGQDDLDKQITEGLRLQAFNQHLRQQLEHLVWEIDKEDTVLQQALLTVPLSPEWRAALALPAIIGFVTHLPLYWPIRYFTRKKAGHNDHYDSILLALLLVSYPFYLILLTTIGYAITGSVWSLLLLIALPLCAKAAMMRNGQT
ncbi:MAG: 1-acyl-sn-glycerol-3-phosphate acyltransferase [Chitinophagaceae bacterium]|nr:1-acyl-sn-glycerol-3-phosphate acyltransferase [Chitinophagaceae bacterium]